MELEIAKLLNCNTQDKEGLRSLLQEYLFENDTILIIRNMKVAIPTLMTNTRSTICEEMTSTPCWTPPSRIVKLLWN